MKNIVHSLRIWCGYELYPHESLALCELLGGEDARLNKLRMRWELASSFRRSRHTGGLEEVHPVVRYGRLGYGLLERSIDSAEIAIASPSTGKKHACSIRVGKAFGGCSLRVREISDCDYELVRQRSPNAPLLALPQIAAQQPARDRLTLAIPGLEIPESAYGSIEFMDGASPELLAESEAIAGCPFPSDYRALMLATNGLLLGDTMVVRCEDALAASKRYKLPRSQHLLLAEDLVGSLFDGIWYIPLADNPEGKVVHVDMYGNQVSEPLPLKDVLGALVERAIELEASIQEFESRPHLTLSQLAARKRCQRG